MIFLEHVLDALFGVQVFHGRNPYAIAWAMDKPNSHVSTSLKDDKGVLRWRNLKYVCAHLIKRRYAFKGDKVVFCNICGIDDAGVLDKAREAWVSRWRPSCYSSLNSPLPPTINTGKGGNRGVRL
jgi:hypothetical protein